MIDEKEIVELKDEELDKVAGGIRSSKPRGKGYYRHNKHYTNSNVVSDLCGPVDTGFKANVYITGSFDPQSHFENDTDNVIDIYQKITGTKLDLTIEEDAKEGEAK